MSYLEEAGLMQAYIDERPGNTLAGIEFLDQHPEHRLVLESLLESQNGCLYEDTPNYTGGDSLPVHLRRERGFYMKRTKDFGGVQSLLEAMSYLYESPGHTATQGIRKARQWFEKKAEEYDGDYAKALKDMREYFMGLAQELPEIENDQGMTNLNAREVGVKDLGTQHGEVCAKNYILYTNTHVVEESVPGCGATQRQNLVHNPATEIQKDWILRQPKRFLQVFFGIRKCTNLKDLKNFCEIIRDGQETRKATYQQIQVLWGAYFGKRDWLRSRQKKLAAQNMSPFCTKLLFSIDRQCDAKQMGRVGTCLYNWSKGDNFNGRPLPKPLTHGEWSIIWDAYKQKKAALQQEDAELQVLMSN